MPHVHRDSSLGQGGIYARDEFPTFVQRIIIILVDGLVVVATTFLLCLLFLTFAIVLSDAAVDLMIYVRISWVVSTLGYLVVVKRSSLRTLGYRLTGVKVVSIRGGLPTIGQMTLRTMMAILYGLHYAASENFMMQLSGSVVATCLCFDLFWAGIDEDGQTLHDRFSSTCVVKANAAPSRCGEIHLTYYFIYGWLLAIPRVTRMLAGHPGPTSPDAESHKSG